jgi:hypothetical protein
VGHARQWEKGLSIQEIVTARSSVLHNDDKIQRIISTFTGLIKTRLSGLHTLVNRINFVPCPTLFVALELYALDHAQLRQRGQDERRYDEVLEVVKSEFNAENISAILSNIRGLERNTEFDNATEAIRSNFANGVKRDPKIFQVLQDCASQMEASLQTQVRTTLLPYLMGPEYAWLMNTNIQGGGKFWERTKQFIFSGTFKGGRFENYAQDFGQMLLEEKIQSVKADIAISDQVVRESSGIIQDFWKKVQQKQALGCLIEVYVALKYFEDDHAIHVTSMISSNKDSYLTELRQFRNVTPTRSHVEQVKELIYFIEKLSERNAELYQQLHQLLSELRNFMHLAIDMKYLSNI